MYCSLGSIYITNYRFRRLSLDNSSSTPVRWCKNGLFDDIDIADRYPVNPVYRILRPTELNSQYVVVFVAVNGFIQHGFDARMMSHFDSAVIIGCDLHKNVAFHVWKELVLQIGYNR